MDVDAVEEDDDDIDKSEIILLLTLMQLFYFILKLNTYIHVSTNQPLPPTPSPPSSPSPPLEPQQLAFKHNSATIDHGTYVLTSAEELEFQRGGTAVPTCCHHRWRANWFISFSFNLVLV